MLYVYDIWHTVCKHLFMCVYYVNTYLLKYLFWIICLLTALIFSILSVMQYVKQDQVGLVLVFTFVSANG